MLLMYCFVSCAVSFTVRFYFRPMGNIKASRVKEDAKRYTLRYKRLLFLNLLVRISIKL